MPNNSVDTDVLIVGAGPVGLFLANECARRGMRYRIIETCSSQSEYSKALAIFPRTLEIFDMAGVVGPFLSEANRVTNVTVISHHRPLAHMRFEPGDTPYPFVAMVPQNVTERLLLEALRRKNGDVEYNSTLVSAEELNGRVTAAIDRDGRRTDIDASFVVGCDGPRSKVRESLKFQLEGGDYEASYMLADVDTNDALPADEMQLCPSEFGPVAIFPMSAVRRRVVASIDQRVGDAPSLELVRNILAQRGPENLEARALNWSGYFRIHHRQTPKLHAGRIFIAGDAAHVHSPFGGQGMNTGLHDVWNLVWKLDLFLRGHGNDELLSSYDAERLPVIKNVIETTDLLTKVMATPSKFVQALRDTIMPMASHLAPFQNAFVERLSELGIAYRGSPIVDGPGKRYFDDSLRGGNGIASRFLLMTGSEQPSAQQTADQLAPFSDVVEFRPSRDPGTKLVRPDGYLAYSAHNGASTAALQKVREILARQTS